MSARPKKAIMGRPKTIIGKLVTCPFVLTHKQSQWVSRRAKSCKVSRSEIIRVLVQLGITADAINTDTVPVAPAVSK